jgi:hypothetical protein
MEFGLSRSDALNHDGYSRALRRLVRPESAQRSRCLSLLKRAIPGGRPHDVREVPESRLWDVSLESSRFLVSSGDSCTRSREGSLISSLCRNAQDQLAIRVTGLVSLSEPSRLNMTVISHSHSNGLSGRIGVAEVTNRPAREGAGAYVITPWMAPLPRPGHQQFPAQRHRSPKQQPSKPKSFGSRPRDDVALAAADTGRRGLLC